MPAGPIAAQPRPRSVRALHTLIVYIARRQTQESITRNESGRGPFELGLGVEHVPDQRVACRTAFELVNPLDCFVDAAGCSRARPRSYVRPGQTRTPATQRSLLASWPCPPYRWTHHPRHLSCLLFSHRRVRGTRAGHAAIVRRRILGAEVALYRVSSRFVAGFGARSDGEPDSREQASLLASGARRRPSIGVGRSGTRPPVGQQRKQVEDANVAVAVKIRRPAWISTPCSEQS